MGLSVCSVLAKATHGEVYMCPMLVSSVLTPTSHFSTKCGPKPVSHHSDSARLLGLSLPYLYLLRTFFHPSFFKSSTELLLPPNQQRHLELQAHPCFLASVEDPPIIFHTLHRSWSKAPPRCSPPASCSPWLPWPRRCL